MKLEEYSLKVFGKPPNWSFVPESKRLGQRLENSRLSISTSLEMNSNSVKSELKRAIEKELQPAKRMKVAPTEEPVRGVPSDADSSSEPPAIFNDPMHVDAVFTVENPKTPPDLLQYDELAEDEQPVEAILSEVNPATLDVGQHEDPQIPIEPEQHTQGEIMLSIEVPMISNDEPAKSTPSRPPVLRPANTRILNADLNRMLPKLYCDKFLIRPAEDTPPSEDEYGVAVIEPRVKEKERERKQTKFFNPDDYDDEENGEEDGKPKTGKKGKGKSLESQFGVEKGRIILKEVSTATAIAALKAKLEVVNLCDDVAVKNIKVPKLISRHMTTCVDDYQYQHVINSKPGVILFNLLKLSIRNILLRRRVLMQTIIRTPAKIPQQPDSKIFYELTSPQVTYEWLGELCQSLRAKLSIAIHKFFYYKELDEVEGLPKNKLPRNSLELVLDYNEMKVVHEKGLSPESVYLVEFSEPFDMKKDIPNSRIFRLKYQQMIQMSWLYLLLNPQKLVDSIAATILQNEQDLVDTITKSLPKFNAEQTLAQLLSKRLKAVQLAFFESFVTFTTNAELLFKISCYTAIFQDYHITAELPKVPVLSGLTAIKIK